MRCLSIAGLPAVNLCSASHASMNRENFKSNQPKLSMPNSTSIWNLPSSALYRAQFVPFKGVNHYLKEEQCNFIPDLFKSPACFSIEGDKGEKFRIIKNFKNKKEPAVMILNPQGKVLAAIKQTPDCTVKIGFKVGKCPPTLVLKDPNSDAIGLMTQGEIKAKKFHIRMNLPKATPAFKGSLYIPTGFRADSAQNAVNSYFDNEVYQTAPVGRYSDEISSDYSVVVATGGYGTRMSNISSINSDNKAAIPLPAKNRTIIHDILDKTVGARILDTQNPEVEFIADKDLKEDGFIIGKSLREGKIPMDRPAIICPSDYISNIDFSRIIKDFESKPAGIMLISTEIPRKETKLYNLLKINDDMEVTDFFVRKRHQPSNMFGYAINTEGPSEGSYVASLPIFIMHPKVLQELAKFTDNDKTCKIGKNFMPMITEKMKKNELQDDEGRKLKTYTSFAKTNNGNIATFRDIGTFKDFVNSSRKLAKGDFEDLNNSLIKECSSNVDLKSGVVCLLGTKPDFDNFRKKQKITKIQGDIVFTREK